MSKEIYQCQKEIYPRAQHYTRCVPCKKARKDNALVRSSAGGKSLLAKQHAKRKKSLAKGKKARAHSARVRVNFDDDSTMPVLSSGSADDNNSFSSDSAASSDAASSRGLKMSKKTRQKARARANAALSSRGRAHSNSATAFASSRSCASAAAFNSASDLGSSKKHGNQLIFDSGDDSATEVCVVRKKHKKESKRYTSSHGCSILGALPREQDDDGDSPARTWR